MYQNSEKDQEIRERNRKTVEHYFELPHGSEELAALHAPDCMWEQPYFQPGVVSAYFPQEDPDAPMPDFPEGFEIPEFTPEWHWYPVKIYGTDDPSYFFAENGGYGLQLIEDNTIQPYENYYFHTFHFNEEGLIDYYREIANPLSHSFVVFVSESTV